MINENDLTNNNKQPSTTKKSWSLIRTVMFIVIGLMNTVLIRDEDIGSFKNYLGYLLLMIGAIDFAYILFKYFKNINLQKH
jgi:hypothetical protein